MKKYRTYKWLYKKYIIEKLSSQKIADLTNISRKAIDRWLNKHEIPKRGFGGSRGKKPRQWLYNKYIVEKKSLNDISREISEDRKTIHRWLINYNIPRRPQGETRKMEKHPNWRGGKYASKRGYIWIYKPEHPYSNSRGSVAEHRLATEKILKRFLSKDEVVHHIDFKRENSDPSNLYLFSSQVEHARFHMNFQNNKVPQLKSNLL